MAPANIIGRAVGATLLLGGVHFLVRAVTGKTPLEHARAWFATKGEPLLAGNAPPPTDPIDEASWESFPASDPPAHSPKNG